jgi:hypothetical protein
MLEAGTAAASSAERAEAYGAGWRYERSPKRTLGSLLKATLRARGETKGERQPRTARESPVSGHVQVEAHFHICNFVCCGSCRPGQCCYVGGCPTRGHRGAAGRGGARLSSRCLKSLSLTVAPCAPMLWFRDSSGTMQSRPRACPRGCRAAA